MNQQLERSLLVRILFSFFLAIVACGMSFYLVLFVALMATALGHHANPATTPTLQTTLRFIVVPISGLIGVVVFVASMRRGRSAEKQGQRITNGYKKTAA